MKRPEGEYALRSHRINRDFTLGLFNEPKRHHDRGLMGVIDPAGRGDETSEVRARPGLLYGLPDLNVAIDQRFRAWNGVKVITCEKEPETREVRRDALAIMPSGASGEGGLALVFDQWNPHDKADLGVVALHYATGWATSTLPSSPGKQDFFDRYFVVPLGRGPSDRGILFQGRVRYPEADEPKTESGGITEMVFEYIPIDPITRRRRGQADQILQRQSAQQFLLRSESNVPSRAEVIIAEGGERTSKWR